MLNSQNIQRPFQTFQLKRQNFPPVDRSTSTNKVKEKVTWTANEDDALMAGIIEERKDSIRDTDDMDECIWEIGNGLSSSEDDWNVIDWEVVSVRSMMNSKSAVECLQRYLKITKNSVAMERAV